MSDKKDMDFVKFHENFKKFIPLLSSDIRKLPWPIKIIDRGDEMSLYCRKEGQKWQVRYLIDTRNHFARELIDSEHKLINISDEDIDWESLKGLKSFSLEPHYTRLIRERRADEPFIVGKFNDDIAEIEWVINSGGIYLNDGFNAPIYVPDDEVSLFGYIDRIGNIIGRLTYIGYRWGDNAQILNNLHQEALKKAWRPD